MDYNFVDQLEYNSYWAITPGRDQTDVAGIRRILAQFWAHDF